MQPTVDDGDRLRPTRTRRVIMRTGAVIVVLGIGMIALANPTGSPGRSAPKTLSTSAVPPVSGWVSFTAPDGRFSASFPGSPQPYSEPGTSGGADVTTEGFGWSTSDAATRFDVAYIDYPAETISTGSPETFFGNIERGMITSGYSILASQPVDGGYPGHEVTLSREGQQTTVRAWIAGDTVYFVASENGALDDTESFLESFRILAE